MSHADVAFSSLLTAKSYFCLLTALNMGASFSHVFIINTELNDSFRNEKVTARNTEMAENQLTYK